MKKLDPKAVWLFFVGFILKLLIPVIIFSIFAATFLIVVGYISSGINFSFSFLNWLWLIIPAVLILCFIWAKLTYFFYKYELVEDGFRKELGVISKKYVTIPYDRIQNVDIYRGFLARMFGLSDLNIQTAGMSAVVGRYGAVGGAEGRLPGLSKVEAELLRNELIQRARQFKNPTL